MNRLGLLLLTLCIGLLPVAGEAQDSPSFGPSGASSSEPGEAPPAFGPNYGTSGTGAPPPESGEDPRQERDFEPPSPPEENYIPPEPPRPPEPRPERIRPSRQSQPRGPATPAREVLQNPGVLKRFAQYAGPRTFEAMRNLFHPPVAAHIVQAPAVALSDGETPIRVEISGLQGKEPDIALSGARLLKMEIPTRGPAVLYVVPEQDAVEATIFVLIDGRFQEVPLTVVPLLPTVPDGPMEPSAGEIPRRDWNADGALNFIDDYIYVGNLLAGAPE